MNIAVGARKGIVDDLFVGNFLGRDCMLGFYPFIPSELIVQFSLNFLVYWDFGSGYSV